MPSPSGGAPAKTCSICGIDVSGKPRTKDAKGHYYCNPCFGTALARRKAAEAGASTPSKGSGRNAPAHNLDADDGLSLLSELIDGGPEAPPIATPTVSCPQCGAMTSPGSVICVHCGYNFSTNTVGGKTKIAKAPRRSGGGGNIWPMVVGILCLAFGGLNVLAGVIFMIIMLMNGQIAGLGQAVGILISMLLVTGGVRIIQHNRRGVFLVRLYAGIMLFFCTCIFVGVRAIPSFLDQPDENGRVRIRGRENESSSPTFDAKNMQAGINFFSIVIVGTLIPPAGMLIFFALPPIRKDVAQWS